MGNEEPLANTRKSLSDLSEDELPSIEDIFRSITTLRNLGFTEDFFNEPVDIEKYLCPDYYVKITHPMDFGTMEMKYRNGVYQNSKKVIHDVNLIFQNAMKYNPPGFKIHEVAKDCTAILTRMIQYSSSKRGRGKATSKFASALIGEPTFLMTAQSFLLRWMGAAFQFNYPQYPDSISTENLVKKLMADAEEEYNYRLGLNKKLPLIKIYNQKPLSLPSRQKGEQFPFYSVLFSIDDDEFQDLVKGIPPAKKVPILAEFIKYFGVHGSERKKYLAEVIPVGEVAKLSSPDDIICELCKKGNNEEVLLLCDRCDKGFHCYCVVPQVTEIPDGQWYCPNCSQDTKLGESPIRPTKKKKTESREVLTSSSGNTSTAKKSSQTSSPQSNESPTSPSADEPQLKDSSPMEVDKPIPHIPAVTPVPPPPPTMTGMKAPSNRVNAPIQTIDKSPPTTSSPASLVTQTTSNQAVTKPQVPPPVQPPKPAPPVSSTAPTPTSVQMSNIENALKRLQQPSQPASQQPSQPQQTVQSPAYGLVLDLLSSQRDIKSPSESQKQTSQQPPQQSMSLPPQAIGTAKSQGPTGNQQPSKQTSQYPPPTGAPKQAIVPPRKISTPPPPQMANFNYPLPQKALQPSAMPKIGSTSTTAATTTNNIPRPSSNSNQTHIPQNPPHQQQNQQSYNQVAQATNNQKTKPPVSNGQGKVNNTQQKSSGTGGWNTEDVEDSESDTTHSTPSSPAQDQVQVVANTSSTTNNNNNNSNNSSTSNNRSTSQNAPSGIISEAKAIMYGVTSGVQKMYQLVTVLEQALLERDQARTDRDTLIMRCQTLEQAVTSLQHNHDVWKSRHEIMQDKEKSLQMYIHEKEKHLQAVCERLSKDLTMAKSEQAKAMAENAALKTELFNYKQALLHHTSRHNM